MNQSILDLVQAIEGPVDSAIHPNFCGGHVGDTDLTYDESIPGTLLDNCPAAMMGSLQI